MQAFPMSAHRPQIENLFLTRREMLCRCGMGFGAMGLASLMAQAGLTSRAVAGEAVDAAHPLAPRMPQFPARAKRVIHIFVNGGPSHVDTFDPKPALERYAGKALPVANLQTERKTGAAFPSPFKFQKHGQSGLEVSEVFPHVASCADDLAVIRSMQAELPNHEPSLMLMNCGDAVRSRPSVGSWVTYGLGTENQNLPGFIAMCPGGYPIKDAENWQSAFLPGAYQGTYIDSQHTTIDKLIANIRNVRDSRVGDTVTDEARPAAAALPGYRHVTPMVFAGLFPTDTEQYQQLKEALEKLQLNDAALVYEPETSAALGFGFRCGFLGLLHMEIVQERLEREFNLTLLGTAPTVEYRVKLRNGEEIPVDNPDHLPDPAEIEAISEPMVTATIVVPSTYVGNMMELSQERRGQFLNMQYEPGDRVVITYRMPLAEIIHDYYDQLKSRSKGYASLDYELVGFEEASLVKLDVLVAGSPVDALSMIVDRSKAQQQGRRLAEKLKTLIPRQLYEVPIQAAIGGKIVARETVPAMRKDVTAKCYGGDVTRKRKLLEKQKEGKKRLKRVGNVEIPQEAFMAVLSLD